jgi:tetratricopeptide (TPR) repeat protein
MLKQYKEALPPLEECVSRSPNYRAGHVWLAATYAQLGYLDKARAEASEVLRIQPTYTISGVGSVIMGAIFKYQKDVENVYDGLRKAGLPE